MGAGMDLALGCDIRVVRADAELSQSYVNVGLSPGTAARTCFPPRRRRGREGPDLLRSPHLRDGGQELGIASTVVDGDAERTREVAFDRACELADGPTVALGNAKQLVNEAHDVNMETGLEHAIEALGECRERTTTRGHHRVRRKTSPSSGASNLSDHRQPAGDAQHLAGDERRVVRCHERDGTRDVLRFCHPSEGDLIRHATEDLVPSSRSTRPFRRRSLRRCRSPRRLRPPRRVAVRYATDTAAAPVTMTRLSLSPRMPFTNDNTPHNDCGRTKNRRRKSNVQTHMRR